MNTFKEKELPFILLLSALFIRLFFFLHFQDPLPTGHPVEGILKPAWSIGSFVGHYVPPMAIYLIKISRLFNDTAQGVRLPNLILGSLLVIPFYYLVRVIYNQEVAFFSGLALAVFYKHIHMSASSYAEIPLYTFLFTALALFFWFKETKKPLLLLLSSISLNLATMSRYESWVFIPLLTVFLLKEKKRYLIGFFLLSLAFPLLWMYLNYKILGSPLEFFVSQTEAVKEQMSYGEGNPGFTIPQRLWCWFNIIKSTFTPWLFWPGVFGLAWSLFKKRTSLAIVFLTAVSLYIFKSLGGTLVMDMRYTILLSLFFLVFITYGIYSMLEKIKFKKVILYGLALALSIYWLTKAVKEYPPFPVVWNDFIQYFQKNPKDNERIAVTGCAHEILTVNLVRRNLYPRIDFIGDRYSPETKTGERQIDKDLLANYINSQHPDYIVIDSNCYPFTNTDVILKYLSDATKAECVFKKYDSFIYKMTYERN